jgi:hypothetical protein
VSVYTAWCSDLFESLAEGGVWGVPRSGLVFRKDDGALVLIEQMPHFPGMPMTAAELTDAQDADFAAIRREFERAGVPVRRAS